MSESTQNEPTAGPQLSRRQALAVGGGLAAVAAAGTVGGAGAAAAQTASPTAVPDPTGSAEPTASPSPTGPAGPAPVNTEVAGQPQTLLSISLEQAQEVIRAAEQEAGRIGVRVFIVVVDACGDIKASSRQDGNGRASLQLAPPKAQTALAFRTATSVLGSRTTDPIRQQAFFAAGFSLLGGGVPITSGGQVIGAIGVGGGSPEQDEQIAVAGLTAAS